jgi:tyrosinase
VFGIEVNILITIRKGYKFCDIFFLISYDFLETSKMYNLLIISIVLIHFSNCLTSEQECENKIYRECNHESKFTDEEISNAGKYIQQRYAKTNPTKPPCSKFLVRKNIKCLTEWERTKFIAVFKKLYDNGFIDEITKIHSTYWPAAHKFSEALVWHRWIMNELEKKMLEIDPTVTLPYWQFPDSFAAPEKDIIFEWFGHAGNESNDYCVTDGAFANQKVNYPEPHCIRRQWNPNGTICNWEPPEYYNSIMQIYPLPSLLAPALETFIKYSDDPKAVTEWINNLQKNGITTPRYLLYAFLVGSSGHFKTHLCIGGYAGDLSITIATNDVIFWLFHQYVDYAFYKYHLGRDDLLVPESYNFGIRLLNETQKIVISDIDKDTLTYYDNIPVKEAFQVGYGDLCFIHDQIIRPINQMLKNEKSPEPIAVQRLKSQLPPDILRKYFPKFSHNTNNLTFFDYIFNNVGDCNPNPKCRPMPIAPQFNDTENGRRQYKAFQNDANFDSTIFLKPAQEFYYQMMKDLNENYCSVYA